jgi:hypothetical protein
LLVEQYVIEEIYAHSLSLTLTDSSSRKLVVVFFLHLIVLKDHSSSLGTNDIGSSLSVGRGDQGHDGSIGNTETRDSVYTQARVNNRHGVRRRTHLAGSNKVHSRVGVRSDEGSSDDEFLDFSVIVDVLEGGASTIEERTVVVHVVDLANTTDEGIEIARIGEEVHSDTSSVSRIVGVKLDETSRTRSENINQREDAGAISDSESLNIRARIGWVLELSTDEQMTFVETVGGSTADIRTDNVDLGDGVILKVTSNSGKVVNKRDVESSQFSSITYTRETKDLRSTNCSHTHDDFVARPGAVGLSSKVVNPSDTSSAILRVEVDSHCEGLVLNV